MYLAFGNKQLREICEFEERALDELGTEVSESLKGRLADLMAARSPNDLVAGSPRSIGGGKNASMVLDLGQGYQISFVANHPQNPVDQSGAIDWSRVSRIRIVGIGLSRE